MKENATNKKETIAGAKINRESLYYTVLFGIGAIVSAILIYIGVAKHNKGLMIYSIVLAPILLALALVFARVTCVSKNTVYKKNDRLVIKSFLITRKFITKDIKKITVAQNGADGITSVNVKYQRRTYNFRLKKITKEEAACIKRAASDK